MVGFTNSNTNGSLWSMGRPFGTYSQADTWEKFASSRSGSPNGV